MPNTRKPLFSGPLGPSSRAGSRQFDREHAENRSIKWHAADTGAFTRRSDSSHPFQPAVAQIRERDDGWFEIGIDGPGPFPTRGFAQAVAARSAA